MRKLGVAAVVTLGLLIVLSCANNDQAPIVTDAQIEQLTHQLRTMQAQLDQLSKAQGAPAQQNQMRQHWQSTLDYMRDIQSMPWMRDEAVTVRRSMGRGGMMGGGMMGPRGDDWMMHCPMMGKFGEAWILPQGLDGEQYRSQMQQHMQRMQEQMERMRSTTNPAERQRLLQEHWQEMYRHMQTMRGMGWMWGGPGGASSKPLPELESPGARLVVQYCAQCHATPSPELHTAAEWANVTARMSTNMKNFNASNRRSVKVPTAREMKSIAEYMTKFARP